MAPFGEFNLYTELVFEKWAVKQFSYQNTALALPSKNTLQSPQCSDLDLTTHLLHQALRGRNTKDVYDFFRSSPKDQNGKIPLARLFIRNPAYDKSLLTKPTETPMGLRQRKAILHHLLAAPTEPNSRCKHCISDVAERPFQSCLLVGAPDRTKYCTNCQYLGSTLCSHFMDEPTTPKDVLKLRMHRLSHILNRESADGNGKAKAQPHLERLQAPTKKIQENMEAAGQRIPQKDE